MINHNSYFYENLYSLEEIHEIQNIANLVPKSNFVRDVPADGKTASVKLIDTYYFGNLLNKYFSYILKTNNRFFGYELFPAPPDYVAINRYEEGIGEYKYHKDAEPLGNKNDFKLTAILNISTTPYEGGNFEIFLGEDKNSHVPQLHTPGCLLILPSFMYHRVKPVTKGIRTTLCSFIQGPGFK